MTRILGIDFGRKRVGVAISDALGFTAQPLVTLPRGDAVAGITALATEYSVDLVVVGMPTPLGGGSSESAVLAHEFGEELAAATGVDVVFADERFTSRMAERALLESGMKRRDRRSRVDKVAAAIILQDYLAGNFHGAADVGEEEPNDT